MGPQNFRNYHMHELSQSVHVDVEPESGRQWILMCPRPPKHQDPTNHVYINVWYMVYGIWYMVYGRWYMVDGRWYMVYGIWYMVDGIW